MDSRLFLSRTFHRILEHPLGLVRLIIVLTSILAFGVVAYDLVTDRQRTEQAALDSARQQALVQSRAAAEMVQASLDRFDFALQTAVAAMHAVAQIGMPEARIILAQAVVHNCLAPKSNASYLAIGAAIADVRAGKGDAVPPPLRGTART